ncbi:MAG: NifU family protein [Flavobacteriales bacterium]
MQNQIPVSVYAEMTPNPATLKFVANKLIVNGDFMAEYMHRAEVNGTAPLADKLFEFPFVKSLFFAGNFVAVTKTDDIGWDYITMELREFVQDFMRNNEWAVVKEPVPLKKENEENTDTISGGLDHTQPKGDIEFQIIALLDEYVKPAVERDGGAILFRAYDNGIVKLAMKGACAGCPSSKMTLKSGIETLLKQHIAEVQEVEAEDL